MLSLEEPDERLVARLHATGADLSRVLIIGDIETFDEDGRPFRRPWRLPKDCDVLEEFLTNNEVGFVVVDGLGYSVQGDSHNYGAVGAALSSLAAVAERTGCSILGLTHPPKGGSDPATAAIGSTAWTAVARIVWVLGIDPDDETECRRVMRVSKSNFKMPDDGLAFIIGDDERFDCGYVTGVTTSSVSAEALVAASCLARRRPSARRRGIWSARSSKPVRWRRASCSSSPGRPAYRTAPWSAPGATSACAQRHGTTPGPGR